MSDLITVNFTILVKGMVGGSFEMERSEYERIKERWEERLRSHEETELAGELLDLAPFNFMQHLNIDDMEIEDLDAEEMSKGDAA